MCRLFVTLLQATHKVLSKCVCGARLRSFLISVRRHSPPLGGASGLHPGGSSRSPQLAPGRSWSPCLIHSPDPRPPLPGLFCAFPESLINQSAGNKCDKPKWEHQHGINLPRLGLSLPSVGPLSTPVPPSAGGHELAALGRHGRVGMAGSGPRSETRLCRQGKEPDGPWHPHPHPCS